MTITFDIRKITPTVAAEMLRQTVGHGRADDRIIAGYAQDMLLDRWVINGAPIVLTSDGRLLDGRARLLACMKSGASFETLVVEGVTQGTLDTVDALRKRSLGNILTIRSEVHGRALAAALRIIWTYQNGGRHGASRSPSPLALLGVLDDRPSIRESILPALSATPALPHGCGIAIHYLAGLVAPNAAAQFFSILGQSAFDDQSSAPVVLRQVLMGLRGKRGTRNQAYVLAVTIKAFNAFKAGKTVKQLRYSPEHETFPTFDDLDLRVPKDSRGVDLFGHGSSKKASAITAKVVRITPPLAKKMLSRRGGNRPVSGPVISKYARDMQDGRWQLNGRRSRLQRMDY